MPHAVHFISGLPRSGSTLLAAPLRQNPALHANITSPVGEAGGPDLHRASGCDCAIRHDRRRRGVIF